MRFRTSFLITLMFHLLILVVDKGAGFIILWILQDVPGEKGVLSLLTNLPPILMAVSNLGLATSLVYFTRRGEATVKVAGETTSMVALVWGFLVAALAFALILAWSVLDPKAYLPAWSVLIPLLLTPPFLLLISYRNSIQLVQNRILGYNLVHLVPSVAFLPIFLIGYFVLSDGDTYRAGVYARFIPAVVLAVGLAIVLRRFVPMRPRFHGGFFKKAVSYGWRANISSVLSYLNHRLDLYIIFALFLAAPEEAGAEVAFYGLAVTLAEFIWHFPEAMRDLLFTKIAGLSKEEARAFTPVVCRNSFWICLVTGLVIWLLHDPLLRLYMPHRWDGTWGPQVTPALAWLLPGTVFFTIAKVLRADIMARGHVNAGIFFAALVFATMLVGDVFLVPTGGAQGAALASTIAYAAGALGTMLFYSRLANVPIRDLVLLRVSDFAYYRDMLVRLRLRRRET